LYLTHEDELREFVDPQSKPVYFNRESRL